MMYTDIIENDDSERLLKVLSGPLSNSQIYQLAYSSIVNKSYSCMQCVLRHSQLDFYEPFEADGFLLPIIYHAIRLGNLDACKLLLEYGLNPLVCTGLCQLNNTEVICEDVVRFSFRFASNSYNKKAIALLFQTFLYEFITNLVKACKNGDYELTDQLLFSPNSLRIRCTIKNFANREFEHLTNFTSSPEVSSNHFKYVHQPVTSLMSNSFKSLKFNKYLLRSPGSNLNHHEKEDQRHERQQQQLELFSSEEMLRWNSDESLNSHQLLSLTDLWEWARKKVKPLLLICVQNNYINCMDKLLQVGFQVIPVSSTSERLELNRNFSNVDTNYSKSNNVLKPLVEDIRSVRKQLLWIESVYSNEDSAVHAAIRLNRIDAVKSIIRWDPDSLAITISGNEMGILPIHIACALNRLHCLQLILSMNNVPTSSHFKSQHDANIESTTNVKCCALFSCRIHESPALYRHYYCIDQLDSYHLTAFLLAVIHEHVSIVRELLLFRVKAIKLTHYTELDDYRTDSDFNRDHHRLTVQNIDKFTYSNQFNNNGTNNQQLSPSLDNNIDNMYADICPIDIHRKISACWYFAVTKIHDDNNTNSYISADYNRPIIIMNPRCHQSLDGYAVCGYFNALQLSIMTGNIELLSIMVDYLNREVNTYCTSCIHGQCYAQDNLKHSLQSIITSPLGLACCLAEADENKAVQVASILLNTGAVDISNQLFMYTMRKSFHKLAGLLFIDEILKSIELNKSPIENNEVITKHLNLSNKSLQPSIISNSFWYLSPLMPQWIKLIEDALKFSDSKLSMLYPTSLSSSPSTSVPQSVVKENNKFNHELSKYISQLILSAPPPSFSIKFYNNISCQLITRITMSNCGLQTLPWCLFNCMTNLKELDLSKNHIRHLPRKLPNVPMAYREPQTVSSCWSSSLIYLDLSNNYLEYLPTWLFVNQYEYEHGMMISSNGKPRNCQNNFKENYTHNVFAALNTNGNIDSRCRRRCYSENAINSNNFSSLQHAPLMTDSFAPNLLHLLLSKNQLCTLPCEIWAGSLWCKLEFLDLSWNKISYLPFPNLLKVQFEHSRRMYKQSLHMKTQCLQKTNQGQSINSTVQYSTFNSESILLPTDHISTPITNHHQSVKNCNNNDDEIFERRSVHSFYSNGHTSHLTHLWLHHNCLKSLRLTNPTISNHSTIRTHSSRLPQNFSLAQICPNLVYLDASYNSIENLLDLFFCPECIVHIDLSYNQMKIPDRQQQLQQNSLNNSSSSLSCQFGSSTSILSINMGLYDKNASNFLSHLLHGWNTNKSTRRSYFSKLEHLNLRGNQFHLFTCCANTLSNLSSEFKIFNGSQSSLSSLAVSSSGVISPKQEHVLFPKLKSLDLGENSYLQYICPSLVYLTNLQYISLDYCVNLSELPGDLFRLPNLHSILLNKTPYVKHLLPSIISNIKCDQIVDDNDFPDLNKKIYTQRILSCLKSVIDQPSPYTRFRIMVVGPTGVGKTTLVRLLKASTTENLSRENDFNRISIRIDQSPTSLSSFSSSPLSTQSDINGNIPNHLLPLVQVTTLVITRRNSKTVESVKYNISNGNKNVKDDFSETLSFDIWDVERNSSTTNTSSTPDGNNNNASSIHTSSSELDYPTEILINSQLGIHCELTIYLALWRVSDGLLGLNRITPWLMKIKSVNANSPIILIGTHSNDCISNRNIYATQKTNNANSKYPTGDSLSNNINGINNSKFKSTFLQNSLKFHLKLMDQLVRSRFCTNPDLYAYGLPHLYSYMFLNLSFLNTNGKDSEVLMANIYDLCTLIHNAAHSFKINNCTADILLPNISITPSSSHSFSQLPVPKLYHYAKLITEQLSIEMSAAQLPPIMEVNKFIFQLNKRLSVLIPLPMRVCFPSILSNNGGVSIELAPTSSQLHLTSCTHEFSTYSDIKGILLFLNQIGAILHFSHHKFLKNHIILSPIWLLNTLLKLMITLHNQQLFDMLMNSSLKTELMSNTEQHTALVQSSPNFSHLLYQYNGNNDRKHVLNTPKHDNSFHSMKRNSAVISSSYLKDFIKSFIRNTINTNDNTNPNACMNLFSDVLLEDIFMCIFKQFDLIVVINHTDDCFKPGHDKKMKKTGKMKQFLLPSLLAARCFHPNLLHSYLEPAVIRYKANHSSSGVSRYRPRYVHTQSKKEPVKSNPYRTDSDCNNKKMIKNHRMSPQLCCWRVQTSTHKEIVRLYAITYIPPGFWTQLNKRLLNDSSLHEICRRAYSLSKLPSELYKQLIGDYLEEDVSNRCHYDSCNYRDKNIGDSHTFNTISHDNNLKPEWTVWKRGMRLSLGHGQIGLARLQQLTRTNCALLRNQSLKQSFLNSSQQLSSPYSFFMNTNELHSKLLQLQDFEEWDEPCAIVGEEVINKQNKTSLHDQYISNDDSFHFVEENEHTSTLSNINSDVYRSGIVETIKHSYEGRCLRLMYWVQQQDEYEQKQLHSFMELSKSPLMTTISTTREAESPSLITNNKDVTTKTASDFKLHNHGYLIDREHDAFQNSCLIEIYLPNLNIYWKYKQSELLSDQTDKCPTIHSNEISYDQLKVDCQRNHSKFQEYCLNPNPQAIAELLGKLVNHIDTLLEDWYPDLGMKLNQSHEGVYLVERIIPCSACLAAPSYRFNNLPRKPPAASTGSHLNIIRYPHINIANNPSGRLYKSKKDNVNQISLHSRKLSKSVQFLNHSDGLRYSHLNSSTVSLSNYLLTNEETVIQGSDEIFSPNTEILKNNQNNTITEKYSSRRKMSNSSKWSWPFKLNRYERAHSVDPSNTTECNKHNDYKLDNSSTAYSYVYGISISEYIHWYIMQRSDRTLHSRELFCPMHPSVRLWAPDLRFEDISPNLIIPSDRVHLLKFLGRGAFGSVFKGFLKNSRSLMRHQKSQSLSSKNTFTTVNQNTDSDVKYIHDVAVKLCSPVPPNLSNHCIDDVNFEAVKSSHDKWSSSNLCDALVLYHQEQRRWLHNPIEASLTTYQEIRSELNVLLPITNNSLNSYQMKFNKYSHHHSFPTLSYHGSQRISNNIQERRFNQSCFSKCLQKNELHDINSNHITNNNLLICYGIIYPNPIGFLMPLVPLGNLSDYFTSVLSSCQDLLKMVNNSSSSAAEMTDTAAVTNCDDLFLSHPLHPVTMMLIVNQIANALAHLHSLNIIHRDVKSENILIWSMPSPSAAKMMMTESLTLSDYNPFQVHIVLTDYGASRFMSSIDDMYDDEGCRGYVGTPGYMAPEILEYLGEQTYDSKVDIYAMGILLCEMIQLEQPYKKSSSVFYRLAQQVIAGVRPTIPQRFLKCCPTTLINLMTYCWASDSNRRPTADQIVLLTNPWWLAPTSLLSSSSSSSTNSEGSTRYSLNRNKSMNLSEHLDYNSSFSIRYCLSSSKCSNGFSHIQSVSSIDALRVVTCATIDNNYNLWLGGYNHLHESLLHNDDKVKSMKLGLLYIMPLNNIHPISILLSSWPKLYILKHQFITDSHFSVKLYDWPIHLCLLKNNDNEMKMKDDNLNILPILMTCLTYFGELKIYCSNNNNSLEYICLFNIQLSQCYALSKDTITLNNAKYQNLFQEINFILGHITHYCNRNRMNTDQYLPTNSSSLSLINRCIHFILSLSLPQICVVNISILSGLMLKFEELVFIDIDNQPVHSGIILPQICSSDVWLSQYNGKLLCYTWNNTHNEISSLSSESSSCLKLRSSWLVPSLFHSKSSVVTHFLIENSHLTDSCECLVEEDESQRTCVWTYLHPDGRLDCWSAKTQNLLKTIHLTAEFEDELFTEKPSTFVFGSVRAMEWLNSSTSIFLLTTHGYLIYISVMINTNDVTTSTYSKTPTEPVTSTNHGSSFATTKILSSATLLSTPSSSSSCQLFHYHGSFSENDFAFIAPLTPSTSVCQVKVTNFAKRILTISKGYLDPISCINYQASSSITTDSTSLSTDSFEIMFNNNHNDNIKNCNITKCLNQQKFYLVKLFCDNFLFS